MAEGVNLEQASPRVDLEDLEKKERLAVKLFDIIDGEAEGRCAISALLILVFGVLAWRLFA